MSYRERQQTRQSERTKIYGAIRKLIKSAPVRTSQRQYERASPEHRVAVRQQAWGGPCTRGYEQSLKSSFTVINPKKQVDVWSQRSLVTQNEIMNPETAKGRAVLEKLIGDTKQMCNKSSYNSQYIRERTQIHDSKPKTNSKYYLHTLNVLKARRMQTLRLSTRSLDQNISFQGEITVDGTGVHEPADGGQCASGNNYCRDQYGQVRSPSYNLSLSEDLNGTTKEYNEKKKVLPVIIIPCHTSTACAYCQREHDDDEECGIETTRPKSTNEKTVSNVTLHNIVHVPRITEKATIQEDFAAKLNIGSKETRTHDDDDNDDIMEEDSKATATRFVEESQKIAATDVQTKFQMTNGNTANLVSTLLNQHSNINSKQSSTKYRPVEDNSYNVQIGSHSGDARETQELSDPDEIKPSAQRAMFKLCYTKSSNPAMKSNLLISDILRFNQ